MANSEITAPLIAGFAATIPMLSVGYHVGWPSSSLPKLLADTSDIPITSDQSSWIASIFSIGLISGALISAVLVNRYGRKVCLMLTVIPQISSLVFIIMAQNFWWFIIARIIAGITAGFALTVSPLYLGEIAVDSIRGALGSMLTLIMLSGVLLTYCIGPWVSRATLAWLGIAIPLVFGLSFIWMPESPYFLIKNSRPDQAKKSLRWLTRKKSVSQEFKQLEENVEFDEKNAGTMKDLVTKRGNRKALVIVIGLITAQQFSGFTAIVSYSSLIFEASGSEMNSSISVIIIGAVQFLSGVMATFTVDLAGRRPLLLTSTFGTALCLAGEALYFHLQANGIDVTAISWLPVTAVMGYMICFSIGLGGLPHVILSEIFPYNAKAPASMVAAIVSGAAGLIVMKIYQIVADGYGIHVAFWGFTIIVVSSIIFIHFIVPETKQKSFKSIQEEMHRTTESQLELARSCSTA